MRLDLLDSIYDHSDVRLLELNAFTKGKPMRLLLHTHDGTFHDVVIELPEGVSLARCDMGKPEVSGAIVSAIWATRNAIAASAMLGVGKGKPAETPT